MNQDFTERRQHHRIYLRAYAFNRQAMLRKDGEIFRLGLVDISMGGARFTISAGHATSLFSIGDLVMCSIPGLDDRGALQDLRCEVRWVDAGQLGVRFVPELSVSTADLQQILTV
ncbi:PilZ domain-containing protein [Desulfovibrio aminophilus]|nr:PilZ domain-containing protein [Desulfovibrio aminophilus]MCM0756568.1 PilZ domain-containing protein [Desulfovibrio aminophilus]